MRQTFLQLPQIRFKTSAIFGNIEVSSRYAPLIAEEKLAGLPGVLNEVRLCLFRRITYSPLLLSLYLQPLVDFLVGWSPAEIRRTREQPLGNSNACHRSENLDLYIYIYGLSISYIIKYYGPLMSCMYD